MKGGGMKGWIEGWMDGFGCVGSEGGSPTLESLGRGSCGVHHVAFVVWRSSYGTRGQSPPDGNLRKWERRETGFDNCSV